MTDFDSYDLVAKSRTKGVDKKLETACKEVVFIDFYETEIKTM